MSNPLDSLTLAAGAEVLPLELLQPLDSSNPASTPVPLGGPEQRLVVTPDPGVMGGDGDSAWLPPSQLLITKDGQTRSIWPVHLAGWQALGWQLQADAVTPEPEPEQPEPEQPGEEQPEPEQPEPDLEPAPDSEPVDEPALAQESAGITEPEPSTETAPSGATGDDAGGGEALLASEPPDFQAMTKAQIVEYCSAVHGVDLDASQTKAELIEQATALETQTDGTAAEDLAALELGDALL
jgi:hypothetical protein